MSAITLQWSPQLVPSLLCVALAVFVHARLASATGHPHASVRFLRLMLVGLMLWGLGNALESVATTLGWKLIGVRIAYIGVIAVPLLFSLWIAAYLDRLSGVPPLARVALALIPVGSAVLSVTNDLHGAIWIAPELARSGELVTWTAERGAWWRLQLVYGYALIAAAWLMLAMEFATAPWSRTHVAMLWLASLLPLVASLVHVSGIARGWLHADMTPAAFTISVAWLAWFADDPIRRRIPMSRARLVNELRSAILVADADGAIVRANPAACELTGVDARHLRGRVLDRLLPFVELHADRASAARVSWERADEPLFLDTRVTPVSDGVRQLLGWLVMIVDRTEEAHVEHGMERAVAALDARAGALEDAGRARTSFLATISHELRAPLGAIVGFAELLKDGMAGPLGPEETALATRIHETGTDLLDHINSLLDLEKSEAGALELQIESVDPATLLDGSSRMLERRAARAGVRLTSAVEGDTHPLSLDLGKTRKILVNLVAYLLSRTPAGGAIDLRLTSGPEGLRARCVQRGEGVRPPDRSSLAEPFWQTGPGTPSDSGARAREVRLGMALVIRLVKLHGGSFGISQPTENTVCFTLDLPDLEQARPTPVPDREAVPA